MGRLSRQGSVASGGGTPQPEPHALLTHPIHGRRGSPLAESRQPVGTGRRSCRRPAAVDDVVLGHRCGVTPHERPPCSLPGGRIAPGSKSRRTKKRRLDLPLDKLGVTGSSPVPPTIMKAPLRRGFLRPGCDWLQALNRGRGKRMARFKATTSPTDPSGSCSGRRSAQHVPRSDCAPIARGKSRTSANRQPSLRDSLPCRRSWVRVPSSALETRWKQRVFRAYVSAYVGNTAIRSGLGQDRR
jgi:hypothetical protein